MTYEKYNKYDTYSILEDIYMGVAPENKPFSECFCELMDKKKMTSAMIVEKTDIDKSIVSKLKSGKTKNITRSSLYFIILAMELNMDEANELLKNAGMQWMDNDFDALICGCIKRGISDVFAVKYFIEKNDIPYK